MSTDGRAEQRVGSGSFTLDHEHSKKIIERITLSSMKEREAVKVKLDYEGIAFGDLVPSTQTQSIHYWIESAAREASGS